MAANTNIEWTDATWNPTVGCSVVSPGCTNCYAMKLAGRLEAMGSPIYRGHTIKTKAGYVWNGIVAASNHGQMLKPLSWKKPRRIFVNSMSDLFHEDMPQAVIDQVFAVMALCPQHTFQILSKRSGRMQRYMEDVLRRSGPGVGGYMRIAYHAAQIVEDMPFTPDDLHKRLPLPNLWLGVSVEDQKRADERIPDLLATPAAVRFLSCEPLLGPVNVTAIRRTQAEGFMRPLNGRFNRVDWVIAGGESGPGKRAMDLAWMRSLRGQCVAACVPFFAKQDDKVRKLPPDLIGWRQMPGDAHA